MFKSTLTDGDIINLICTNYKNPTYPSMSDIFSLMILDNEKISNEIFSYPDFQVNGTGLKPWPLAAGEIKMNFILDN